MLTTIFQFMPLVKADPVAPTVITNDATGIGTTYATLQGTLTNDGGENSITGFEYGFTTEYGTKVTLAYVYAGGLTTQTVIKYLKSDMSKVAETEVYGGTIRAIVEDNDYIYVGGNTNGNVVQYWKSNMTKKAEVYYSSVITSLAQDSTYIYAAGGINFKVFQYLKSDMTKIAETTSYTEPITSICTDNTYVYAGINLGNIYQSWKSNMTDTGMSANYGNTIRVIISDGEYIYAIGSSIDKVYQYWVSNMTKKAETVTFGDVYALTQDDTYIYVGGGPSQTIRQYWKSNMTKKTESVVYGGEIEALTQDDLYVYAGGETTKKVRQYLKSDMSFVAESVSYGSTIYALSTSNDTHATGDTFSFNLTGLVMGTPYHYRAYANNSVGETTGSDKNFTTVSAPIPPNHTPDKPTCVSPSDIETNVSITTTLKCHVIDSDNDNMSVSFYWINDSLIETINDVINNTDVETSNLSLSYDIVYSWYIITNDSLLDNTSNIFTFTTEDEPYVPPENNPPEIPELISPDDEGINISINTTLKVSVLDIDDDLMNVSFYWSNATLIEYFVDSSNGVIETSNLSLEYNVTYYWYATADDGSGVISTVTFSFTTELEPEITPPENNAPTIVDSIPRIIVGNGYGYACHELYMIWKHDSIDVGDLEIIFNDNDSIIISKYNYTDDSWDTSPSIINLNDYIRVKINDTDLPFKDTKIIRVPQIRFNVNDTDNDTLSIIVTSNSSGDWEIIYQNDDALNGWHVCDDDNMNNYDTAYYYNITVGDGTDSTTETFMFITTSTTPVIPPLTITTDYTTILSILAILILIGIAIYLVKRR